MNPQTADGIPKVDIASSAVPKGSAPRIDVPPFTDQPLDGELIFSEQPTRQERNPRLVLSELINAKADAKSRGTLVMVEAPIVPVLYFEWTEKHAAPAVASYPAAGDGPEVFRIEATVPSEDGTAIAVVEFSTAPACPVARTLDLVGDHDQQARPRLTVCPRPAQCGDRPDAGRTRQESPAGTEASSRT
ncbi:hypothetical protein GCM10011588_26980 [Nocardia jinanensis]|uniref:Uncharacterized protein n=1 Tax=Nocardia jinanensis TaxID=382504 RepID=A0A917VSZ6_9NOCA|nr:hypothetical protein GCM10011588_26980 [Nocardia jinanensis]